MFLKKLLLIPVLSFPVLTYSQTGDVYPVVYRNEFSIISDNDLYTFRPYDAYYTNGTYVRYAYAANRHKRSHKNDTAIKKVIHTFEAGQAMFTPVSPRLILPEQQDRPFAGYLTLSFNKHIFYRNNTVVNFGIATGTIGPNAGAEQFQRWWHKVIGLYDVHGWHTQLKNELSLNLSSSFVTSLHKGNKEKKLFNIDGVANAQLGNAFISLSGGALFRLGAIENNWNSSHWGSRISADAAEAPKRSHELYIFYEPLITLQAYSAVLQGGMFVKDKGPAVENINPVIFTNTIGVRYAKRRFTTAAIYIFRSKQAKEQLMGEKFCSLQISYRFKRTL